MSFRTSHTGSLPRPDYLLEPMFAREGGAAVDEGRLDEAIERATAHVVERQKQAGALRRARPASPNTRALAPGNCSRSSNS